MVSDLLRSLCVGLGLLVATVPALAQESVAVGEVDASTEAAIGGGVEPAGLLENPPLGIGLFLVADWASQQPFINVMKSARTWIGHLRSQSWGGWHHEDLDRGGYLDENGWPTAIPPELSAIATLILTDLSPDALSSAGDYRLTYSGQGRLTLSGAAEDVRYESDEIWFRVDTGTDGVIITIEETDPQKTGDYIRDIVIVRKDKIALYEAGEIFNPHWMKLMQDFRLLRFKDWMAIDTSAEGTWIGRPTLDDYTYARNGVPLEVMLELANRIGADPWFCMPHLADDDYFRRFAVAVKKGLSPNLKAHVEFSNEVWNWQFRQAQWAEDQGRARWGQEHKWVEYYSLRATKMAQIWDDVFGAEAGERLVKVIATHPGWIGLEEAIMEAPTWASEVGEGFVPPYRHFDAYGTTGYISGGLVNEEKAPMVRGWIAASVEAASAKADALDLVGEARDEFIAAHRYDHAVALAGKEVRDGSLSGNGEGSVEELLSLLFPHHAASARKYDLDLIVYEGGTHVVGTGAILDDDELTEFMAHFNYTPEMAGLIEEVMNAWRKLGGTVFTFYVDVASPSKWGSWGALRHLDDNNPRWNAMMRFNKKNEAWWETRAPGTFLNEGP